MANKRSAIQQKGGVVQEFIKQAKIVGRLIGDRRVNGLLKLIPRSQIARFLNQSPFSGTTPLHGSFSFTSTLPVAALALRAYTNQRSETLVTTLPVVDLVSESRELITLPHFADGGGWTTQIVLLNTTDTVQRGTVEFFGLGSETKPGEPVEVTIDGVKVSSLSYTLPERSARLLVTAGSLDQVLSGFGSNIPRRGIVGSRRLVGLLIQEIGNHGDGGWRARPSSGAGFQIVR